jgi:hypothetical protein
LVQVRPFVKIRQIYPKTASSHNYLRFLFGRCETFRFYKEQKLIHKRQGSPPQAEYAYGAQQSQAGYFSPHTTTQLSTYSNNASQFPTTQTQSYVGPSTLQTEPQDQITDRDLYKQGARVRGKIRGTKGKVEELDESEYW